MRDPAFDYVGADELQLDDQQQENVEKDRATPVGIVPIWRARETTDYRYVMKYLFFPRDIYTTFQKSWTTFHLSNLCNV